MPGDSAGDASGGVRVGASTRTAVAAVLVVVTGVMAVGLLSLGGPARTMPGGPGPATAGNLPGEALPSPRLAGPLSLEEALGARRSVRSFSEEALTRAEIGGLLWAAQGVTDADGHRTAPSAGALYPLELDVVTADGLARYVPEGHRLIRRGSTDLRPSLRRAALDQAAVGEAPLIIVISAVVGRTASRYGPERAERYVALEAGHAAQNVLLGAVSLGLGAVPIGAFDDAEVRRVLGLDEGEDPLYLIPVGHPR